MEEENGIQQSITEISHESNGENALKILYLSAYFAPALNMHLDMFSCLFDDIEEKADAAVLVLKQKSLIDTVFDRHSNKQAFFIKKSTQKEIRALLKQNGEENDVLTEAIALQSFHLIKDEIHPNYIDHASFLLIHIRESNMLNEISIQMPSLIVNALRRHGRFADAYAFAKKVLKFLEETVGESHSATLNLQHNLATVLGVRGHYTKAIKVLQELNKKDLKYSTKEEIAKSLVLHAQELCELSKYEEALPLYEVLIGKRTVLDTFDSEILTAWHDYALLLSDMGRHSGAIDILEDVLLQRRKVLSADHKYGLDTRRAIASVFQAQGNYNQAMKHLKEALFESEEHLGKYHLDTIRVKRDIGILLLHKGDYEEALKNLEDAEKEFQKIFPHSHLDILCTRANITGVLSNLKDYNRALVISEDVYEGYKNILGEKNKETLMVKFNIGAILFKQGNMNEALKTFRNVYEGFHDIFGPEHVKTKELEGHLEILDHLPVTEILHAAAHEGDLNKVVGLVNNNVDLNEEDFKRRRPLHYAALNGHIEVAKYLLKNSKDYINSTYI